MTEILPTFSIRALRIIRKRTRSILRATWCNREEVCVVLDTGAARGIPRSRRVRRPSRGACAGVIMLGVRAAFLVTSLCAVPTVVERANANDRVVCKDIGRIACVSHATTMSPARVVWEENGVGHEVLGMPTKVCLPRCVREQDVRRHVELVAAIVTVDGVRFTDGHKQILGQGVEGQHQRRFARPHVC